MEKIIAMIPARMGSSRFPGKPLIRIDSKTMIEHVWQRVKLNKRINSLYIATCDEEIRKVAESFGAEVIMTSDKHPSCNDRIAEGCLKLDNDNLNYDIVLNIQGDEPLLNPKSIDLVIDPLLDDKSISCVNLIEKIEKIDDINDYNNVKVVFDKNHNALYLSRLPIPYGLKNEHFKQLGLYGFKREVILKYPSMKQTPLELAESDDMLRFIENQIAVKVIISPYKTIGVDTPNDYEKVCSLMKNDEIFQLYRDL